MSRIKKEPSPGRKEFHVGILLKFISEERGIDFGVLAEEFDEGCRTQKIGRYSETRIEKREARGAKEPKTTVSRMWEWAKNEREFPKDAIPLLIGMTLKAIEVEQTLSGRAEKLKWVRDLVYKSMLVDFGVDKEMQRILSISPEINKLKAFELPAELSTLPAK